MVVKPNGVIHFNRGYGASGAGSRRVILPVRDDSRVKVTQFFGFAGDKFENISEPVDETVWIVMGHVRVTAGGVQHELYDGACYYVPAGEAYTIEILQSLTQAICVFSQAADGTLPTNEPDPE